MNTVAAADIERDARNKATIGGLRKLDGAAALPLLQTQFTGLHRLVRLQLQIHHGAFESDKSAVGFRDRAVRTPGVFWIVIGFFVLRDEGPLPRIQCVVACDSVARLDAIANALATNVDRRGKFVLPDRQHLCGLPAILLRIGNDESLARPLTFQFHTHTHRVALGHFHVPALRLANDDLCAGDSFQICAGEKRTQKKRGKFPTRQGDHDAEEN